MANPRCRYRNMRFVLVYIAACVAVSLVTGIVIYPIFEPASEPAEKPSIRIARLEEPKSTQKTSRLRAPCTAPTECDANAASVNLADMLATRFAPAGANAETPLQTLRPQPPLAQHEENAL